MMHGNLYNLNVYFSKSIFFLLFDWPGGYVKEDGSLFHFPAIRVNYSVLLYPFYAILNRHPGRTHETCMQLEAKCLT